MLLGELVVETENTRGSRIKPWETIINRSCRKLGTSSDRGGTSCGETLRTFARPTRNPTGNYFEQEEKKAHQRFCVILMNVTCETNPVVIHLSRSTLDAHYVSELLASTHRWLKIGLPWCRWTNMTRFRMYPRASVWMLLDVLHLQPYFQDYLDGNDIFSWK